MNANTTRWAMLGLVLATSALSLSAQGAPAPPLSTAPYDRWKMEQLTTPGTPGNFGSHTASIQRRDVGAAPETHTNFAHFMMFTSGKGNFTVGGQIVQGADGKKTVKGGDTHPIVIGEMYHIPLNTAHWVVP